MKKPFKIISIILGSLISLCLVLLIISAVIYSPEYIYRVLVNGESKVTDYEFFPERVIAKSTTPYHYTYEINESLGEMEIRYHSFDGEMEIAPLRTVLENNDTTSFIVVKGDTVKYEEYLNGYTKDSMNTSFSSVKSLDSLLIGMAIEDGYIKNVDQSISDFIPEFKETEFETITIKNLLMMRSKIQYEEGFAWFTDDAKTYYMPDLRNLALNNMRIDKDYTGKFHYNNYHPLILGIILERTTGRSVSDYFQEKIWNKIGAENDASWSIDSEKTQFEKMESGLNFKSIDYIKIGSMVLHNGTWNGQDIVNEDWITESTIAPSPLTHFDLDSDFLRDKNVGYQYMWYSIENEKGGHDIFASGKYGQYLYISPENNVVILRTGISTGDIQWWPDVFKQIASLTGDSI